MTWCGRWSGCRTSIPIRSAHPTRILIRPTIVVVFDAVKDQITIVTPVRPERGTSREGGAGARDRAADGDRRQRSMRRLPKSMRERPCRRHRRACESRTPRRPNMRPWSRARRNTSRPATSSRWCCRSASRRPFDLSPFSLYRALRRVNPAPFLYFLDFGGLRDCGIEPGNPGAGARRPRHHPPDRRHAAARCDAARGHGARTRIARRSEGARRASDAARSRPQRCRARREDRHRRRHRQVLHRALQPGDAYRVECRGRTRATTATRSTR